MKPAPFEIYTIRLHFGECIDLRPCLVIHVPEPGRVAIAPMSTQASLFDREQHFWIEPEHPNYRTTGLSRASYVCGDKVITVSVALLRTKLGRLDGELLDDFKEWWGL